MEITKTQLDQYRALQTRIYAQLKRNETNVASLKDQYDAVTRLINDAEQNQLPLGEPNNKKK